jgi:hypothetical protein
MAFINGVRHPLMWGNEAMLPLPPGEYEIHISYNYLGRARGTAVLRVHAEDPPRLVRCRSPFWMWSKGYLRVSHESFGGGPRRSG